MAQRGNRRGVLIPPQYYSVPQHQSWMPALSYYALAFGVAGAFFVVVWGVLRDNADESPFISAGIASAILIAGAVVLREVVFRTRRRRAIASERAMHAKRKFAEEAARADMNSGKLTPDENAALIVEIKKRSDAANVLNKVAAAHREVFELCADYLKLIEGEMKRMNPGSPRLEPFLKGRARVADAHKFHMLRWAEIEATDSTLRAQEPGETKVRVDAARHALSAVETALQSYPAERNLLESWGIINELVVTLDVNGLMEEGSAAAFLGDYRSAKRAYRDALHCLARDGIQTEKRSQAAEQINIELERLRFADRHNQY